MVKRKKLNPAGQIVIGFLALILLGTLLLCLPISSKSGSWLAFEDGLLTSTSAVCVTGLLVVDTAVYFSIFGQIVILILIQIGGLGFITLTSLVFLLLGKKITYEKRVTIQESLNQESVQGVVKLVKNIIILVFCIEFVGFLMLAPSFVSMHGWATGLFEALFFSISSFCNAGFDILGTSSSNFSSISCLAQSSLILLPIAFLVVIGGIGYVVLFDVGNKFRHKKMSFHSKVVLIITGILLLSGSVMFAVLEWNNPNTIGNMNVWDKIVNSLFMSVTPRTAGYSTFNVSNLTSGSLILTDILMFIGGSPASTAGGVKTITIFVLILAVFKKTNTNGNITFCKKSVSNKLVQKSLRVIMLAIMLILVSSFMLCVFEGGKITSTQAFFETISAFSTVGLTMGITPTLTVFSKLILVFLMFVGRVGAVTLTLAFANKISAISQDIDYTDSKLMVG